MSRRARITPDQAGLLTFGPRRVPGLRREEVARLAGISTDWYTRLEKGYIGEVSEDVLRAVARVLRLNDEERIYLLDLARAARRARRPSRTTQEFSPSVQWLLDSMTLSAAMVSDSRQDVLATNALGRALYAPLFTSDTTLERGRANLARYHFLDHSARDFYGDWNATADVLTASLRTEAGRDPHDVEARDLADELIAASPDFRTRWNSHDVLIHAQGVKTFHHPEVGELSLTYRSVDLPVVAEEIMSLCVCTAEPGSTAEDQVKLLTSWAASSRTPLDAND